MKRKESSTQQLGPGEYVPDPTEGVEYTEDLVLAKNLALVCVTQKQLENQPGRQYATWQNETCRSRM